MKCHIQLTERAFASLESLDETIAFDIFAKIDVLADFPQMGSPLGPRFPQLKGYRHLILNRRIRIIYEHDEFENNVYILAINDCRQDLPSPRELRRDRQSDGELPLE